MVLKLPAQWCGKIVMVIKKKFVTLLVVLIYSRPAPLPFPPAPSLFPPAPSLFPPPLRYFPRPFVISPAPSLFSNNICAHGLEIYVT